MLIRSQDKRCLVNLNNIDTIDIGKTKDKHYKVQYYNGPIESRGTLGEYSTEEKAIKVLDMVQKDYERRWEVFQMPQDNEV